MLTVLRSIYIWTACISLILLFLPLIAFLRLIDRDPARYRTGRWFRRLGAAMTYVNPAWKIQVTGAQRVKNPRNPYVVVSNHQSMADIPIISRLPWEMKWVSKAVLFRLPVAGWMMRLADDIAVDRSDKSSRGSVYGRAQSTLEKKCSVMFFAEGTRSKDDKVLPFHDGAFKLAIQAQVPILPLAIDGSHDCLPKHSWLMRHVSHIRLAVLDPIDTTGMSVADTGALREHVRDAIMDQLADWRGVTRAQVDSMIPIAAWPEPASWSQRLAEVRAALTELQAKTSEAMARLPQRADEAAKALADFEQRLSEAIAQLPDMAAEVAEDLHARATEAREALIDWQHRAGEAMAELPNQLAEAMEELSAALRRHELQLQPA